MNEADRELLLHNATVLLRRAGDAVESDNETQAAKLAKCATVLVKLARKHSNERNQQ